MWCQLAQQRMTLSDLEMAVLLFRIVRYLCGSCISVFLLTTVLSCFVLTTA